MPALSPKKFSFWKMISAWSDSISCLCPLSILTIRILPSQISRPWANKVALFPVALATKWPFLYL
jgi:hypothetical protein